jgi:hypothetical protein
MQVDISIVVSWCEQNPPGMDQSEEPEQGAIITLSPVSLTSDEARQADRLFEQRVLYPGESLDIPLAEILQNIHSSGDIKEVEIEVSSFYRNIVSKPSQKHKVKSILQSFFKITFQHKMHNLQSKIYYAAFFSISLYGYEV